MDKQQKTKMANAVIDVINAAHALDGLPDIDEKQRPLWMDILTKAPDHIFIHPERYWEVEKYVKEEIKKRTK